MNTVRFFVFLALSSVLIANAAADWPLIDTILLHVYNRNGSDTDVNIKNASDIVPLLDKSQKTVFYVHGYVETLESTSVKTVTGAYLNYTRENVIGVDYSQIAALVYPIAVGYAPHVGAAIAEALEKIVQAGLDAVKIHLVGHSLGGQVCGYTGRNCSFNITQITGLDPAGPLFKLEYLSNNDAMFVDIIHTDGGVFGNAYNSGHVNFLPNFGHRPQPGCIKDTLNITDISSFGYCSHHRSWWFYAESLMNLNAFLSIQCNSDINFIIGRCDKNNIIPMGYATPHNASGLYYCQTNSQKPFGLGIQGTKYNPLII